MITNLTLENFRGFVDKTELEFRPLTMFFGYNSAGKSAILRLLPLLAASLNGKSGMPISLEHQAAKGSSFGELTSELAFGTRRGFNLSACFDARENFCASWNLIEIPERRRQFVERFRVDFDLPIQAVWSPTEENENLYEITFGEKSYRETVLFSGLLPEHFSEMKEGAIALWDTGNQVKDAMPPVEWITSVRESPNRSFPYLGSSDEPLHPNGRNAGDILATDSLRPLASSIGRVISSWYERNANRRLVVQWEGDRYKLMTEILLEKLVSDSPARVNLADAGEGLIQVLPILISLAKAARGNQHDPGIVAIEEPESHLHPRLHAPLAEEFFRTITSEPAPTVVVETHSENILLRIQREIAAGLPPEKVIVHWVRQLDDGRSQIEPVTFDEIGRPDGNWPRMVFAEDSKQAHMLLQEQLKRNTGNSI